MPAPTNVSASTATDLGTLVGTAPTTLTQNIRDSGTNYTVWFKYTAVAGDHVIGVFPFGDLTSYRPTTTVYSGTSSSLTQITVSLNRAIQIPVTPGTTYFFKVAPNTVDPPPFPGPGDNTTLHLSIYRHPDETVVTGSLLINDDWFGSHVFPGAILSAADGHVLNFAAVPGSERLDVNHVAGRIAVYDSAAAEVVLFDTAFTPIATIPVNVGTGALANNRSTRFYLTTPGNPYAGPVVPATVQVVNALDGALVGSPIPLPGAGFSLLFTIAVNNAGTILYYTGTTDSAGSPSAIKRFDLVNQLPLSDLATGPTPAALVDYTLMVLTDDTIVALWSDYLLGAVVTRLLHYRPDGTVIANLDLSATVDGDRGPRVCPAEDDLTAIWVWQLWGGATNSGNTSRFQKIRLSDGAVLTQFDRTQFEFGVYRETATAIPVDTWGHSESCFFGALSDPPVTYQTCPCPDDPWPLSTMRDQIGLRLHDPSHIRWTTAELNRIIWEALRTWNAFTSWATGRATVTLTPGVAFYQLSALVPALRGPDVSDGELYSGINDKLLESTLTPQFTQDFLTKSYGRRHQNVLVESGVVLVRRLETINAPSSDGRYPLDPCILAVRRTAWSENGDGSTIPLYRDDQWSEDRYAHRFPQTPTRRPRVWSQSTRPPLYLQLVPIPTHTGTLDFICIIDCTPIPPDWTWVAPFGVLADLLGQSGPGQDLERARYAEARFRHGLEAMKTGSVVQSVRVENTLVPVHATPDLDQYRRRWQTQTGRPREAVTFGHTILGFSPVPDAAYRVTLDLTQIAPLPVLDGDLVYLPPAARDPVLDYCEHLALFKEGPGPLAESMPLLDRFFTAAGVRLSLDQALVPSRGSLWSLASHDQRGPSPHHLPPEPALVGGVGPQPTFPNPEAGRV